MALAHRLLSLVYHLLKEQKAYQEFGPDALGEKAREAPKRRTLRTFVQSGQDVTLQELQTG